MYRPLDVAFRVVGTGSVGLRDYIVYLEGNGSDDPLFLQIKEEPFSAYAPYLGEMGAPQHQGRRVVQGQRAMQFLSDLLLGWTSINNRQYLVRQLNDHKGTLEMEDLKGEGLMQYAEICGELLARGHARAGIRSHSTGTSAPQIDSLKPLPISRWTMPTRRSRTTRRFCIRVLRHPPRARRRLRPRLRVRRPKLKPAPVIKEAAPKA